MESWIVEDFPDKKDASFVRWFTSIGSRTVQIT
jgi:hypothetical protein